MSTGTCGRENLILWGAASACGLVIGTLAALYFFSVNRIEVNQGSGEVSAQTEIFGFHLQRRILTPHIGAAAFPRGDWLVCSEVRPAFGPAPFQSRTCTGKHVGTLRELDALVELDAIKKEELQTIVHAVFSGDEKTATAAMAESARKFEAGQRAEANSDKAR